MQQYPQGLAIHVGTGDCRDMLERTSRLATAARITRAAVVARPEVP